MKPIEITGENFDTEVLKSDKPVLLDFWASWCGPCRMIAPNVEKVAAEFEDKVKVGKVNVDDCQDLAEKFGVESIPTLIVVKDGKEVNRSVGAIPKTKILDLLGF